MQREIKFRAFDKRFKRMDYGSSLSILNMQDNDHEIMQFTGLLDKNGKEIYEGDIVEFDAKEWGTENDRRWEVKWNERGGEWMTGGGLNSECKSWKTVIGNVWENPELLK